MKVNDLAIGYQKKMLLQGLNFELRAGKCVALIGRNGVGKSTLLRTLCGITPSLGGNILLDGKSIAKWSEKSRSKMISVVLTQKPPHMHLSVKEIIMLGRSPYTGWLGMLSNKDKQLTDGAIDMMSISNITHHKLYELSDGQLQKVMIARALAQDTPYVFLDEPTSHLDIKNKIEISNILAQIACSGKTVLISSHEVKMAAKISDMFICLNPEEPAIIDTPETLIKSGLVHRYLQIPMGSI